MKKFRFLAMALMAALAITACGSDDPKAPDDNGGNTGGAENPDPKPDDEVIYVDEDLDGYAVLAYVYSAEDKLPDPSLITHANYAGGIVNSQRNGVTINNENRLKQLVALKKLNPKLKVILTIGGDCKSGFTSMAMSESRRKSFGKDCARMIEKYNLDGIDIDWEFPGGSGGTTSDRGNFTLMMKAIREGIGPNKILSYAGGGDGGNVDLKAVDPYVNYVNVMAYDLGSPPYHHTALYRSTRTGWKCVHEVVKVFTDAGISYDKMLLGLGYYGRGDNGKHFPDWVDYRAIKVFGDLTEEWDATACVPYLADADGVLVVGYDNAKSLEIKCKYAIDKGMRGVMAWRAEEDTDDYELARAVARSMGLKK